MILLATRNHCKHYTMQADDFTLLKLLQCRKIQIFSNEEDG